MQYHVGTDFQRMSLPKHAHNVSYENIFHCTIYTVDQLSLYIICLLV